MNMLELLTKPFCLNSDFLLQIQVLKNFRKISISNLMIYICLDQKSTKYKIHFSMSNFRLSLILFGLGISALFFSCKKKTVTEPDHTRYPELESQITALPPAAEGALYGMDLSPTGIIAATFAQKLYVSDVTGNKWTLVNSTDKCYIPRFSEDGQLYVITEGALIRYDASLNKTILTTPVGISASARIQIVKNTVYLSQWLGYNGTGIHYSTDKGQSWQLINFTQNYQGYCVTPQNEILLATNNSFSYSPDFGKTWQKYSASFPTTIPSWSGYDNSVKKLSSGRIFVYAIPSNEYYYSDNNGATFTKHERVGIGLTMMDLEEYKGKLYATFADFDGHSKGGIYVSHDNGTTWNLLFNSYSYAICTNGSRFVFGETLISSLPTDLGKGIGISDDDLNTFRASGPQTFTNFSDYSIDINNNLLLSTHGALYRKLGDTWQMLATPGFDNLNKIEITPQGKIAFFYHSIPSWNGKGKYSLLIMNPDGSFGHGHDILDANSHSYYWDDQVFCTAARKNGDIVFVEATYSPTFGTYDQYPYKMQKVHNIDGNNQQRMLTNSISFRQIIENFHGNLFGLKYPNELYPNSFECVKSTDGGITWENFSEDVVPLAFKKKNNSFFGYDRKVNKYYISNPENTQAYEITFSQPIEAKNIIKPMFNQSGNLYFIYIDPFTTNMMFYKTKTALE